MNLRSVVRTIAAVGVFAASLVTPVGVNAQSTFGSVRGTTVDASGAAIPIVTITLHSVDENTNASVLSDDAGNFVFENLKPGRYSITAAKEGFARAVVNQVELVARQNLRVDVSLNVAAQAQSVEVNASAVARAPYQNWLLLMDSESIGNQSYQAGIVEFTHRASRGLTFQANYTFAKNLSDVQGSDAPTAYAGEEPYAVEIANHYDLKYDRGHVVGMLRQRFLLTGTYQLPFGTGQALQGPHFLNPVIGGWILSMVTTMQTGQWLTPTMPPADDQSNTDMILRNTGGAIARPDCVGNPNPYANQTSQQFYNLSAFALPPANAGRFGSCGVGACRDPA
jgi:hypothetical protein